MPITSAHGAIRRFVSTIDHSRKISAGWIHSLPQFEPKPKPPKKNPTGNPKKSTGGGGDVYMRDTVAGISRILRYSTWEDAQRRLRGLPIKWDSYTVNQVLKTHPPMEKAWLFFLWAARVRGFKHDHFTYTTMLDIFGEAGRISSMECLFWEMEEKGMRVDAATYTSVLHWLAKDGNLEGSARVWEEMRGRGCRPTVVSYTAFMKVLFDYGRPKEAAAVYREMLEAGLFPNSHTYTVLMEYLAGTGKFEAALEILCKMQETGIQPDKATCNILVQKCSKSGETSAMFQILRYMKENSLVLRRPIFLEALEALKIACESDHLLREVNPHLSSEGLEDEISDSEPSTFDIKSCIDRGIIFNLLARQNFVAIEHIINGMICNNVKLDSKLISAVVQANCRNCRLSGALIAFHYCLKMGKKIERSAYVSLIGLLIRKSSFIKVLEIVEEMIKVEDSLGTYLVALLILKLGYAGMTVSAEKLFYSLPADQNLATYTALLDAYFQSGNIDRGLELYSRMRREGVPVSSGMYEVLIVGLQKAGRIQEAEVYRKEKKRMQFCKHSEGRFSLDESLCDRLFDGGMS